MTIQISRLANNQTFGTLTERLNLLLGMLSSNVVTLDQGASGAVNTGNGQVNGYFYSTVLSAGTLRGGTVASPNTLPISSNAVFQSYLGANVAQFLSNSTATWVNCTPTSFYINPASVFSLSNGAFRAYGNGEVTVSGVSVGNSSVNVSVNSTSFSGTAAYANNSTYAYGKGEAALNVNSAAYANNSTYAYGKGEAALNVNSAVTATTANNSTYAYGKGEAALNVNSAASATNSTNANNASYLGGSAVGDLIAISVAMG